MVKHKLDPTVKRKLSENVSNYDRSVIAVIGSSSHLVIPSIYTRMIKLVDKSSLSVLWLCSQVPVYYETDKKKVAKLLKRRKSEDSSLTEQDMFTILLDRVPVNFIHYQDGYPIINSSYDLLVVEDFSSLTPGQLASACECVKAPGCVIFLLNTIKDLKELYTLKMDSQKIFENSSQKVHSLFNERFLLSLMTCPTFFAIDDNLKLVPLSNYTEPKIIVEEVNDDENQLSVLKNSTADTQPLGCLVNCCKTLDQAKSVIKLVEIISSRESHVACLLGPRGRGKSAALGLAVVSAINLNYSNIFITTSQLDGLQIIFHYILLGLERAGYKEGEDYQVLRSSKSSLFTSISSSPIAPSSALSPVNTNEKIITRINIIRTCRQFVQFISPYEASQDELFKKSVQLLIIDEAASIPIDQIKSLIGPHTIFTSITNNGFKASGHTHVSNVLKELRRESKNFFDELTFNQPILYSAKDSVENWLNSSFCLDWSKNESKEGHSIGCPSPDECQLFYINRATLFSYHKAPETLLRKLMSLYFSSEYIANANVIQSMADSPNHHLFCLLPPTSHKSKVPEVLCFVFLRLEDEDSPINWTCDNSNLIDGDSSISKLIQREYLDSKLLSLHGARVIKIAVNPKYDIPEYGYDRRALQLVEEYFKGNFNIKLIDKESSAIEEVFAKIGLDKLDISPRVDCDPLFLKLEERRAEVLDYIVVNIGMTQQTLKFWRRNGYTPIYIDTEANETTREHDCILIRSLIREDEDVMDEGDGKASENQNEWLINLWEQFRNRFISLLSCSFLHLKALLAVEVLQENDFIRSHIKRQQLDKAELEIYLTLHDLKRLEIYSNFRDDYRRITDLLPHLARFFFLHKFGESIHLSPAQLVILLGVGLQGKTIDEMGDEIGLPGNQILAHFLKSVKKFSTWFNTIQEKAIEEALGLEKKSYETIYSMRPIPGTLEDELEDASERIKREEAENQAKVSQELKHLSKYAIKGREDEWDQALMGKHKSIVSIKSVGPKKPKHEIDPLDRPEKRKQKFKKK